MIPDTNAKGDFMLWDRGKPIGYAPIAMVDGRKVLASLKDKIVEMQRAALRDGVILTLAAGIRTYGEQMELRKAHLIDKSKINDIEYLTSQDSGKFNPVTAKPGFSNHHDGTAYDFNVTGKADVYRWLVSNAGTFGFIRTVPSEKWHWEHRIGDKFSIVPKNHPSWDGLV